MKRKIKAFGLTLIAVLALTAMTSAAAKAQFTYSEAPAVLSAGQTGGGHQIVVVAGFLSVSCTTVTFTGSAAAKTENTLVLTPTYSECTAPGGRKVDVTKNTLSYKFTSGKEGTKGDVDVSGEMIMTITTGEAHCTLTLKPQINNGVTYKDLGATIEITHSTNNLHTTVAGGFLGCATLTMTSNTSTYTGTTVLSGTSGGNPIQIDVH